MSASREAFEEIRLREYNQDMRRTYTAVIRRENHLYVAECPEVGTASQGLSIEEALSNLREATELYLEEFPGDV